MKMFQFSLQKLLEARKAQEEAEQMRLAQGQLKLERMKAALRRLRAERTEAVDSIAKLKNTMTDRTELSTRTRYLQHIDGQVDEQTARICEQEAEIEKTRGKLLELMKKKRTLERLCEHEKVEWHEEGKRIEIREMDEIAIMSMARHGRPA